MDAWLWVLVAVLFLLGSALVLCLPAWRERRLAQRGTPRLITVATRPGLPWDPAQALGLMRALLALRCELALRIHAHEGAIAWEIVTSAGAVGGVSKLLHAFDPGAEVAVTEPCALDSAAVFPLTTDAAFFLPVCDLAALRAFDPLKLLVGAMADVEVGEAVVYQIKLSPTDPQPYRDYAWRRLRPPPNPLALLSDAPLPPPSPEERETLRIIAEKLATPVVRTEVAFGIKASAPRVHQLRQQLLAGLSPVAIDVPFSNGFTWAHPNAGAVVLGPAELAALWHLPTTDCQTQGIARSSAIATPLPAQLLGRSPLDDAVLIGTHTYQGRAHPVPLELPAAETGQVLAVHLVGAAGMGKTHTMRQIARALIARGVSVIIIGPPDWIRQTIECDVPPGREADVVVIDPTDPALTPALNLLAVPPGVSPRIAVGTAMRVITKLFEGDLTVPMLDTLQHTVATLVSYRGHLGLFAPLHEDAAFRNRVLARVTDTRLLAWWERHLGLPDAHRRNLIVPLLRRIESFTRNPLIERMVCQDTCLDPLAVTDAGKSLALALALDDPELGDEDAGRVIGAGLVALVQLGAMRRYRVPPEQRRDCVLFIDEVQTVNAAASLSKLLSECRKYRIGTVVAHQYLSQLAGDTLDAVLANTSATILFQLSPGDAKTMSPRLEGTIPADALTRLDRHQAVVRMRAGTTSLPAFPMTTVTPPPTPIDARERAERIKALSHAYLQAQGWLDKGREEDANGSKEVLSNNNNSSKMKHSTTTKRNTSHDRDTIRSVPADPLADADPLAAGEAEAPNEGTA